MLRVFRRKEQERPHKARVAKLIEGKQRLLSRLALHDPDALPKHINMEKLEAAYKLLEGYEFVLRKRRGVQI